MPDDVRLFDGPAFGKQLKKHMKSEGLRTTDVARDAGIAVNSVADLRRGEPPPHIQARGQTKLTPSVNTLSKLAGALGLQLPLLLSWGKMLGSGDRFTGAERDALAYVFGGEPEDVDRLLQELVNSMSAKEVA